MFQMLTAGGGPCCQNEPSYVHGAIKMLVMTVNSNDEDKRMEGMYSILHYYAFPLITMRL